MKKLEKLLRESTGGKIALIGFPFDRNSSFLAGASEAPAEIRKALNSRSTNLWSESGIDIGSGSTLVDLGDLEHPPLEGASAGIEKAVSMILAEHLRPLCLGGDHSITWPVVRAVSMAHPGLNILHFDAHPDLYDELDGNRESHASPFARIMEEGLAKRLVQVGIRTTNRHQREQAERFGVEMIEMKDLSGASSDERYMKSVLHFDGPLYISFDIDGLDPAFAPGVSHFEPGGLSTRQAIDMIQQVASPGIVGADIVEYNPARDRAGETAYVCAKILKELAARMLEHKPA